VAALKQMVLPTCLSTLSLFLCLATTCLAQDSEISNEQQTYVATPFANAGHWRSNSQTIFDEKAREILRKNFTILDRLTMEGMSFEWISERREVKQSIRISGRGSVRWRYKNLPAYDPASIFAVLQGAFRDGSIEGTGSYSDVTGVRYSGEWKNGQPWGQGTYTLRNGDEYFGSFRAGVAEGHGRYTDTAGEIYDGVFSKGFRHGKGITTLPSGRAFASYWNSGKESERSRLTRTAQLGTNPVSSRDENIRINMSVNRAHLEDIDSHPNRYIARNVGSIIEIRPESARLMELWKGRGSVHLSLKEEEEISGRGSGILTLRDEDELLPIKLRAEVQNKSPAPIQIVGLYLRVEKSASENKPAIQMRLNSELSCNGDPHYNPTFILDNLGWSAAENATFAMEIVGNKKAGSHQLQMSKTLGSIEKSAILDLQPELKAFGVDTDYLKSIGSGGFPCRVNTRNQCLNKLRATGKLGSLANKVQMKGKSFFVNVSTSLSYSWTDSDGKTQVTENKFDTTLPLAFVRHSQFCGAEQGSPQIITTKTQQLRSDDVDYKLPISFQLTLGSSRSVPLVFAIEAPKSSSHNFTIILQLSDGREINSRPINLLYYRPRWTFNELLKRSFEPKEDDEQTPEADDRVPNESYEHPLYNSELLGRDLRTIDRKTQSACRKLCDQDAKCRAWSHAFETRKCSLKASVESVRLDYDYSSGLKIGVERPPNSPLPITIRRLTKTVSTGNAYLIDLLTTRESCERMCDGSKECLGYNFKPRTAECTLLDDLRSVRSNATTESGIKEQAKQ
jgi:hypothetical protein